jgi:hypothetical protein
MNEMRKKIDRLGRGGELKIYWKGRGGKGRRG